MIAVFKRTARPSALSVNALSGPWNRNRYVPHAVNPIIPNVGRKTKAAPYTDARRSPQQRPCMTLRFPFPIGEKKKKRAPPAGALIERENTLSSAVGAGLAFPQLIQKILDLGLERKPGG